MYTAWVTYTFSIESSVHFGAELPSLSSLLSLPANAFRVPSRAQIQQVQGDAHAATAVHEGMGKQLFSARRSALGAQSALDAEATSE